MVGIGTVAEDDPSLTTRLEGAEGSDPIRIVLDTHLSISPKAKLLHLASHSDTFIISNHAVAPEKRKNIEETGARVLTIDCREGRIDLKALVRELGELQITSLLIEGGSHVNGSALRAGIVDKIYMFYAPKLCAGDDGVPICSGPGVALMEDSLQVNQISVHRFEDDVMIEGYLTHR
jgi:diaminohydroxyphosphoribosylaminopyrimidine deaminase/5-amino-6-(5-phosphoribosylamino)uracil reductase